MAESTIQAVQVEALVVMKIIKHCAQAYPTTATGSLVGMDSTGSLQVTNTFPFPTVDVPASDDHRDSSANVAAAAPRAKLNITYQNEMIKLLREVNIDANNVGWYTSASMGNFINLNFVENQYFFQKELGETAVALVYDVGRSETGNLSLRAYRLADGFMSAYKEGKFTVETIQKSNLKYQDILTELPLTIHNSHLLTSLLHQLPASPAQSELSIPASLSQLKSDPYATSVPLAPNLDALDLSIDPFLEKSSDLLLEAIEAHTNEQNNHQYYQRSLAREQAKITAWQQKRKAENSARVAAKQTPLPEDEWKSLFKLPTEPGRLEILLNSRQVEQYARQVDGFTAGIGAKMFGVRGALIPE